MTLVLSFTDPTNSFHPMKITSDGSRYYTTNGGNEGSCRVNTFDLTGALLHQATCSLDNRSIQWYPAKGALFTKDYYLNANRIDALTGDSVQVGSGWFAFNQSSPVLSADGLYILEHESGTIRVLRATDGQLVRTLTGFRTGAYPTNEAVAVDDAGHILTWDGTTVYIQDMNANLLDTAVIPYGHYGFALSFTRGLLFTADDVSGQTARWYGYAVSPG